MESKSKGKISAAQFFIMLFVSRIVITITMNSQTLGGDNLLDNVVSCGLSMLLGFLIALPLWLLHRRHPGLNVNEVARLDIGRAGKAVPLFYLLYFIAVNTVTLSLFEIFLMDTVNPDFSAVLIIAAIVAVALYGAVRGLETVARCASCVFVLFLVGVVLVFAIVSTRFRTDNLEPLFYNGFGQTVKGTMVFVARTSIFADMAILLPLVRGRKLAGFSFWSLGTGAFISTLLLLVVGCLGRYAYTQNFPVYILASITEVRSLQRLDSIFIGVWMMGLIIKLACDFYACRLCLSSLGFQSGGGKKFGWAPAAAAALVTLALTVLTVGSHPLQKLLYQTDFLLIITLAMGMAVPLLLLLIDAVRFRKRKKVEK